MKSTHPRLRYNWCGSAPDDKGRGTRKGDRPDESSSTRAAEFVYLVDCDKAKRDVKYGRRPFRDHFPLCVDWNGTYLFLHLEILGGLICQCLIVKTQE